MDLILRIIVPLKYRSKLRRDLFTHLHNSGYTWSRGMSLNYSRRRFLNMAYIAIRIDNKTISYSSNIQYVKNSVSDFGYNYILVKPRLKSVLKTMQYLSNIIHIAQNDESTIENVVLSHNNIKNMLTLYE